MLQRLMVLLSANVFQMKYPKNCDIFHYDFEPLDPRLKKEDKREFFKTFAKSNKHIFKNTGRHGFAYDGEKNIYTTQQLIFDGPRFAGKVSAYFRGSCVFRGIDDFR